MYQVKTDTWHYAWWKFSFNLWDFMGRFDWDEHTPDRPTLCQYWYRVFVMAPWIAFLWIAHFILMVGMAVVFFWGLAILSRYFPEVVGHGVEFLIIGGVLFFTLREAVSEFSRSENGVLFRAYLLEKREGCHFRIIFVHPVASQIVSDDN
jgi:hypothetical protein